MRELENEPEQHRRHSRRAEPRNRLNREKGAASFNIARGDKPCIDCPGIGGGDGNAEDCGEAGRERRQRGGAGENEPSLAEAAMVTAIMDRRS
jgi:hypothetical protein